MNIYEQYNQYLKDKINTNLDIVSTGYGNIDKFLAYNGMQPDFCFVVLGKSGTGKTYFIINMALKTVEKKRKVLFFSLEMSFYAIMDRFNQVVSGRHLSELTVYLKENEKEMIDSLTGLNFFENMAIYDGVYTIDDINQIIEKEKPDVVYIDHLHLVRTKYVNIFEKTTFLMEGIFWLKKKHNTRFIVLVQVKRDGEEKHAGSKPSSLESGKGSGAIEENSDFCLGLGRPDIDPNVEGGKMNIIEAIPRKCRFPSQEIWEVIQWRYDRRTGKLIEIL